MMLMLALALAAPDAPNAGRAVAAEKPATVSEGAPGAASCKARKFETTVKLTVGGQPKSSKVRMCGREGQTEAEWIATLKDAIEKVEANEKLPPAARTQIVTAVKAEIARLELAGAKLPIGPAVALPPAKSAPPKIPSPRLSPPQYSTYAPLPPPPPPAAISAATASVQLPLLSRPRLSFACFTPGDLAGDGPCFSFVRDTMLIVRAGEDIPPGTSLRFVRNGDSRADIDLAQLRKGKFVRLALPREVCQGVVGGKLQIRIVRSAPGGRSPSQEVGTEGPYNLTC